MKHIKYVLMCSALTLCGCENVKDAFGLSRSQPDEFSVAEKPALTIPKDFRIECAPDQTAANKASESSTSDAAEKAKKIISQ
ncbi:MAG: DUF3035 domain-containing protein [Alphaproteobacteria bacterium]|nr:DUF3035 domain-containing protein [Alphaproteobacteria bacterium]